MGLNKPVDFTTAKLLKEKGFDENCRFGYNGSFEPHHIGLIEFGYLQRNSELLKLTYSAPTIAEVIDWLYEKHGIWISVLQHTKNSEGKYFEAFVNSMTFSGYNSPTEAYEAAIEYCLNKLI